MMLLLFFTNIFIPNVYAGDKQEAKPPIVHISEIVYNFGLVVEGEQVVHDFLVQNRGASILEIQRVKTG